MHFLQENICGLIKVSVRLVNTLRPIQNGRLFADDTFKRIFLNEDVLIWIKISLKFVAKGPINNIPALVQIMAWRRPGDKPLSETMMVCLPTHICVTQPQWVKGPGPWFNVKMTSYQYMYRKSHCRDKRVLWFPILARHLYIELGFIWQYISISTLDQVTALQ